jgi:hypothetical protein
MKRLLSVAFSIVALQWPLATSAIQVPVTPHQQDAQQQPSSSLENPRVFITDSQSWEVEGSAGGANGAFAAHSGGGARPQTAEIIKTFGQRCPSVTVNNKQVLADYIVVLDHEGGKGYLRHRNKVAVFERVSGDVVVSHSTLSLGGSVEEACQGIGQHWAAHGKEILNAKQEHALSATPPLSQPSAPISPRSPQADQASAVIESAPSGADIEIDGAFVGNTPSNVIIGIGTHEIAVKKTGFTNWNRKVNITGGSIHLNAELGAAPAQ